MSAPFTLIIRQVEGHSARRMIGLKYGTYVLLCLGFGFGFH